MINIFIYEFWTFPDHLCYWSIDVRKEKCLEPHGVEQRSVLLQPQQLVGCGHVVCNRLLAIEEERVWRPDVTGQQVVK